MAEPKKITEFPYVVFDMDGTLLDSMRLYEKIFIKMMAEFSIGAEKAKEFYTRSAGIPLEQQLKMILADNSVRAGEMQIRALVARFRKAASRDKTKFFPGAKKLVRELSKRGINVMISSGAFDESIAERLSAGGLTREIPFYCGSGTIPKGPAHIAELAKKLRIKTEDLARYGCFCGDGETDMRIATQTGLYPIGVTGTVTDELLFKAGAKRVVNRVGDLLQDF